MRKILMMAVLAFLSLQGVGARASGISLLESGKKKCSFFFFCRRTGGHSSDCYNQT